MIEARIMNAGSVKGRRQRQPRRKMASHYAGCPGVGIGPEGVWRGSLRDDMPTYNNVVRYEVDVLIEPRRSVDPASAEIGGYIAIGYSFGTAILIVGGRHRRR